MTVKASASAGDEATSPYVIAATAATTAPRPRVLKQGDAFAVLDDFGNAFSLQAAEAPGLYFEDTRYLAQPAAHRQRDPAAAPVVLRNRRQWRADCRPDQS